MSRASAFELLGRTPSTSGRVRQVALPPAARRLGTLSSVDYEDAFLVGTGSAPDRTPLQWARAILENAPIGFRTTAPWAWFALGLKHGSPRSARFVLGWEVRRSSPDFALLGARARLGLEGEVLVKRRQHTLLVATFVQLENPIARAVWAGVAPGHRQVVRYLLEQAGRPGTASVPTMNRAAASSG